MYPSSAQRERIATRWKSSGAPARSGRGSKKWIVKSTLATGLGASNVAEIAGGQRVEEERGDGRVGGYRLSQANPRGDFRPRRAAEREDRAGEARVDVLEERR